MDHQNIKDIQQDASIIIAEKLEQMKALIKECEALARESGITFELPIAMSNYFDGSIGLWQNSSSSC